MGGCDGGECVTRGMCVTWVGHTHFPHYPPTSPSPVPPPPPQDTGNTFQWDTATRCDSLWGSLCHRDLDPSQEQNDTRGWKHYLAPNFAVGNNRGEQESLPVGCVPTAAVASTTEGRNGVRYRYPIPRYTLPQYTLPTGFSPPTSSRKDMCPEIAYTRKRPVTVLWVKKYRFYKFWPGQASLPYETVQIRIICSPSEDGRKPKGEKHQALAVKGEKHPTCSTEFLKWNPGHTCERRTCYHGATKPLERNHVVFFFFFIIMDAAQT